MSVSELLFLMKSGFDLVMRSPVTPALERVDCDAASISDGRAFPNFRAGLFSSDAGEWLFCP